MMNIHLQKKLFAKALTKHILLLGVLSFFSPVAAQFAPGQLRKEMLKSEKKPQILNLKKHKAKPLKDPALLAPAANPLGTKGATLVYLEHSESLSFDQIMLPDAQVVRGNVRFRHDNALLYCDSAYFYDKANSLDAFGNVRIVQGDTLFAYGDVLYYDGNIRLARLRHNVRMVNRKTTLFTDSLNYDRNTNLAYYFTGGRIVDQVNTLNSVWGQYSPSTNQAVFRSKVKLVNKNFTLNTDTLQYNTKSSIADIVGPSHIVYNAETDIFTNRGWYNTASERMMLLDRSLIKQKDGKTMVGDTIFYDKKAKYAEGFSRVVLNDTAQNTMLIGNYVNYNEVKEKGLATDSAILVDCSSKDTLYLHADSLQSLKDSVYHRALAYRNVRFFRNDIQGLADSLAYCTRDSILHLYHNPILWSDNNQMSGELMHIFTKNNTVERVQVLQSAIAIQHHDSVYYNQLSGKELIAYIDSAGLKLVTVNGNAETVFYPVDDKDSTLIGMNKTESSYVKMMFKNKKIDRVVLTTASTGNMYPLFSLKESDIYLKNFVWAEADRPKNREDIFRRTSKTVKSGTSVTKDIDPEKNKEKMEPENGLKQNNQVQ